jgi:hypothetical protein
MLKFTTIFITAVIVCSSLTAQQQYSVSGSVTYSGEGLIYIYLVDEEISKIPFTGIQTIILTPEKSAGTLPFIFSGIEAGAYGIRCYQDTNGNGELDRGLFGPKEPWGMSWQGQRPRKWPRWSNFSFEVVTNISGIAVVLEE